MRQFKLINENKEEFNLTDKSSFFHTPSGLGFGTDAEYLYLSDFYIPSNEKHIQLSPSGTISFDGYESFEKFKSFCQSDSLVLAYKPLDRWRYLDVVVANTDLGEISEKTHRIDCSVQFTAKSRWYENLIQYKAQEDSNQGKRYSYSYPYIYKNVQPGVIEIDNGNTESYCKIHILGPVLNPSYFLYKNSVLISGGKINCQILIGRKLVINSNPVSMEIAEYTLDNQFVINRYQDSDFTTDRLFKLPKGKSRIAFTHEGEGFVNAFAEVQKIV